MFIKKDHFSGVRSFFISERFLMLIIICGIALYARQYFFNRSLWYDEAAVSLDIIRLPTAQFLHQPMPYNQAAPLGFLLIERSLVSLLGTGEYVLRAYSFFCGSHRFGYFPGWRGSILMLSLLFSPCSVSLLPPHWFIIHQKLSRIVRMCFSYCFRMSL
jgi:hypothetical protein